MAVRPARNLEGTIVSIYVDVLALGFQVERLHQVADVTHGVRLWIPRPKCGACGHEPPETEPLVDHSWITPAHPIMGAVQPWVGGFNYGLQRPAEVGPPPGPGSPVDRALTKWAAARQRLDDCGAEFEEDALTACAEWEGDEQVAAEELRIALREAE